VRIDGQDIYRLGPEARARFRAANVGFVFQQFHLIPYLSARENVLAPALAGDIKDAPLHADELLEQLGLAGRAHHVPAELSTGERQRVALARALLGRPKLLLADEPTGNLDEESGATVLTQLSAFARESGAVLLVTHDRRAAAYAQRVLPLGQPMVS
jgi:predicted ABC-type transport system involved in lysophospholipase L1 biosynthesis ATPase subunit